MSAHTDSGVPPRQPRLAMGLSLKVRPQSGGILTLVYFQWLLGVALVRLFSCKTEGRVSVNRVGSYAAAPFSDQMQVRSREYIVTQMSTHC